MSVTFLRCPFAFLDTFTRYLYIFYCALNIFVCKLLTYHRMYWLYLRMEVVRMLSVLVEYDSHKLGGNTVLIPFEEIWLPTNTCRELLQFVLTSQLELPELLSTAQRVKTFCVKQHEFVQAGSGSLKEIANATACIPPHLHIGRR